jgi:hypothetical protein
VWVIDTKRYKGKVSVSRPMFGAPKLLIAGRARKRLLDGLERQVELVRSALADEGDVPVHAALCLLMPSGSRCWACLR